MTDGQTMNTQPTTHATAPHPSRTLRGAVARGAAFLVGVASTVTVPPYEPLTSVVFAFALSVGTLAYLYDITPYDYLLYGIYARIVLTPVVALVGAIMFAVDVPPPDVLIGQTVAFAVAFVLPIVALKWGPVFFSENERNG